MNRSRLLLSGAMSMCLVAAACGDVEGRRVQEGSGGSAGTSTGKGGTDSSGGSSQGGDSSGGSSRGGKGGSGGSEPM